MSSGRRSLERGAARPPADAPTCLAPFPLQAPPGLPIMAFLSGRTVVQFSTGTPAEARDLSNWLTARGVNVLDGAIMAYPSGIGTKDAKILLAGPAELYSSCKPILDCLGGDLRHVSEEIGAAAVLDMALLTFALSKHLDVWHGARACEAEGLGMMYSPRCYRPMTLRLIWRGASIMRTTIIPAQRWKSGMRQSTGSSSMPIPPRLIGKFLNSSQAFFAVQLHWVMATVTSRRLLRSCEQVDYKPLPHCIVASQTSLSYGHKAYVRVNLPVWVFTSR